MAACMRHRGGQGEGKWRRAGGFSLVEVVSSLGIISFGLIALLGLLPVGLQVSRDARESTAEAQINQYLTNLARQTAPTRWKDIVEPRVFAFDRQGLNVPENSDEVFYLATLAVETNTGTVLPSDSDYVSSSLSTLRVTLKKSNGSGTVRITALHLVAAGN
ncbi:MAG: hypothetical protein B9S32_09440 [Verrucomicrobia bacterium Tous-C9LFEB]|nr:MAG: hypothetical protein B9S32_09440 [Verrucomicrobia bacterium Tous-C9LFEB]